MAKKNIGIKRTLRGIMMAGALGLSTLGGINHSYAQGPPAAADSQEYDNQEKSKIITAMPEKLTQEGDDFYQNPLKEYDVYKRKYMTFALDGVIDSKDVEGLKNTLEQILTEIDLKILDPRGKLKKSEIDEPTGRYLQIYAGMRADLRRFQEHLRLKEEWLRGKAFKGEFWNYGSGLFFYSGRTNNGTSHTDGWGSVGIFEQINSEEEPMKSIYFNPTNSNIKVLDLSDEFPAKTKFNYWLGLLAGFVIPQLAAYSSRRRRRKRGKTLSEDDVIFSNITGIVFNAGAGFLFFDSLHPIVYPARLASPVINEGVRWLFGKKDYRNNNSKENEKPEKPKTQEKPPEIPDMPIDLINPWEIETLTTEGKKNDI